jgi:hypothetical protein
LGGLFSEAFCNGPDHLVKVVEDAADLAELPLLEQHSGVRLRKLATKSVELLDALAAAGVSGRREPSRQGDRRRRSSAYRSEQCSGSCGFHQGTGGKGGELRAHLRAGRFDRGHYGIVFQGAELADALQLSGQIRLVRHLRTRVGLCHADFSRVVGA